MGFLADLSAGLQRGALAGAGALSEDVYREQAGARSENRRLDSQRKQAVAQHILQAIHSGQVDESNIPELHKTLGALGYNVPIQALGPSIEAKHALAKYANEQRMLKQREKASQDVLDYFGRGGQQPGLNAPPGSVSGQPGLAALDAMMPKNAPASSASLDFSPDQFDSPLPAPPAGVAQAVPLTPETDLESQAYQDAIGTPRQELPQSPDGADQLPTVNVEAALPRPLSVPQQSKIPATPGINPAAPSPAGDNLDDLARRAFALAQTGDPAGKQLFDFVLDVKRKRGEPMKPIEVNGALVDPMTGKVVYQSPATDDKSIREFNAMLDQAGITDPAARQQAWADYVQRKGAGASMTVNYGGPTAGIDPITGKPVFFQPSNKGGAPNIIEGVAPAPKDKPEKALPGNAVERISNASNAAEDTARSAQTFKPEYGGHWILGRLSNTIGRTVGDPTGQSQWWADLDAAQNMARHNLFGSALTKTELAAWERTAVNPTMAPEEIKKNLDRRTEIERRAAAKLAKSYMAQGYSPDGIRELLGSSADYLLNEPTPKVEGNYKTGDPAKKPVPNAVVIPPGFPKGSKFAGYGENGERVYRLPDGSMATE